MKSPIRTRLVIVAVLGVFTAALSAATLYRAIGYSNAQRIERARDAVADEIARLGAVGPDALAPPTSMVGLRAGVARGAEEISAAVPAEWRGPLAPLLASAAQGRAAAMDVPLPGAGAQLVARVEPVAGAGGRLAWSAIAVKPSPGLQSWRMLVVALTVSTLLLLGNALWALVTVSRAAKGLQAWLRALARDLSAPIPRSEVRELGDIAGGIATLARHLAEARRIQERLGKDLARQERLAALGRVVAGVAHEVRNPLASIKLRLDLAMAQETGGDLNPRSPLSPTIRQAIAHASSEITRLDRLVADLLIVSGRPPGTRVPVAMGELVRVRAEALAPWSELRRVEIDVEGEGRVSGDPDAIARALDNLLRNAVEASPEGGKVVVRIEEKDEILRVTVEDRGSGVPAARAAELFEPFFTTKADGTGLGLAISRAVARSHGGDVVYAREGEGSGGVTRFELILPAEGSVSSDLALASVPANLPS